jgi:hypothetical protein
MRRPSSAAGLDRAAAEARPAADSDRVRVAVRARPLVPTERAARAKEAVIVAPDGRSVLVGRERQFVFDDAYGTGAPQEAIYNDIVAPLVEGCFSGNTASQRASQPAAAARQRTRRSATLPCRAALRRCGCRCVARSLAVGHVCGR